MGFRNFVKGMWEESERERAREQALNRSALAVFEVLQVADVFSPFVWFFQAFKHDPTPLQTNSWTFFIDNSDALYGSGYNANDIVELLEREGIASWSFGVMSFGDIFFSVDREQAARAEGILLKHGIPLNPKFIGAPEK